MAVMAAIAAGSAQARRLARRWCSSVASSLPVAVVGTGPAGFYTAKYLLAGHPGVHVDLYDALPTPFGLVRSGVAPDHPEVKSVQSDFTAVAQDARCTFLGNVTVGSDVSVECLKQNYAAVVLATGAQGARSLDIPGHDLPGVMDARDFVNWYNGHPSHTSLPAGWEAKLPGVQHVVIVGNGNVALDCARILAKPASELGGTDICNHALQALGGSGVKRITVLGRRGHVQGAFTIKELRELGAIPGATCTVSPQDLAQGLNAASREEVAASRARKRQSKVLEGFPSQPDSSHHRQVHLQFLSSPHAFLPGAEGGVGAVEVGRTRLEGEAGRQRAVPTGEKEVLPADMVLTSVGYKSVPLPGVPFDSGRGVVPSVGSVVEEGVFATGWLRRGPSGIIGTNIPDAKEATAAVLQHLQGAHGAKAGSKAVLEALPRSHPIVSWAGAQAIHTAEEAAGAGAGKPREKLVSVSSMLTVAGAAPDGLWER